MSEIKPQFKGNLGMFLVCVELSKQNLIALPTSRNTKGYDIIVLNPETNRSIALQVKCTDRKDFPILSSHWRDYEEKIEERIMADFVFVDISDLSKPNYYIVPQECMKDLLKSSIRKYQSEREKKRGQTLEDTLKIEAEEKRRPNLWAVKLGDVEGYRDGWGIIVDRLRNP